ncbi:MAG: OmpA family protein [Ignavibacteria bacterium]|nr:OmpA family protein [Ignavibacteria bacterium]
MKQETFRKNHPFRPQNQKNVEENRRVELKTTHKKLLEWIYIEKIDRTATPPIIRFKPFVDSEAGLKNWNLVAYQNSEPNLRFEVSGEKQPPKNIDWKLEEFQKIIPRNPEPIIFSLSILDEVGTKLDIKEKTLPIEVKTIVQKRKEKVEDFELEKFSLILFDFDKATIEGMNKQIVSLINSKVKPNSLVSIVGYTDKTGESEYNRKLSEQRAYSVKSLLKGVKATAYGVGETILLYDNNLPEGRFYCRTVEVVIKNPIK